MTILRYWRLYPDFNEQVAWPIDNDAWKARRDLYDRTTRPGRIDGWVPLDLELRDRGRYLDNIASVKRFCLYSKQLRDAIEAVLGDLDAAQWLPVTVRSVDGSEVRDYWVLQPLVNPLELVNEERSVYGKEQRIYAEGPELIKAVLDPRKVEGRNLTKYPYGPHPIVSDRIRLAIEAAGCTGVVFEPVPVR